MKALVTFIFRVTQDSTSSSNGTWNISCLSAVFLLTENGAKRNCMA